MYYEQVRRLHIEYIAFYLGVMYVIYGCKLYMETNYTGV